MRGGERARPRAWRNAHPRGGKRARPATWLVAALVVAAWLAPGVGLAAEAPTGPMLDVVVEGDGISVRARDASLRSVLAAVASRTALSLRIHGDADRPVTVSFERLDLTAAIDRIVRRDYVLAGDRLILFLHGPGVKGPVIPDATVRPPAAVAIVGGRAGRSARSSAPSPPIAPPGVASPTHGEAPGAAPASSTGMGGAPVATSGRPIATSGTLAATPGAPAPTLTAPALTPGAAAASDAIATPGSWTSAPDRRSRSSSARRSGGVVAAPEVLDPAEAQRLAREIDERSVQSPPVETVDVTGTEAVLRQLLP